MLSQAELTYPTEMEHLNQMITLLSFSSDSDHGSYVYLDNSSTKMVLKKTQKRSSTLFHMDLN